MRAEELLQYVITQHRTTAEGAVEYRGVFQRASEQIILSDWTASERLALAQARLALTEGLLNGKLGYLYDYDAFQELRSISREVPQRETPRPVTVLEAREVSRLSNLAEDINRNQPEPTGMTGVEDMNALQSLVAAINSGPSEDKGEEKPAEVKKEEQPAVVVKEKKKRWIIPTVITAAAAVSLPFWAIPYPVTYTLPDGAMLSDQAPGEIRFYEQAAMPECIMDGKQFAGWYTDSELKQPISRLQYTLGPKRYFAKFIDAGEEENTGVSQVESTEPQTADESVQTTADPVKAPESTSETAAEEKNPEVSETEQSDEEERPISVVNTEVRDGK